MQIAASGVMGMLPRGIFYRKGGFDEPERLPTANFNYYFRLFYTGITRRVILEQQEGDAMKLRVPRYFLEVARVGNVTCAAQDGIR